MTLKAFALALGLTLTLPGLLQAAPAIGHAAQLVIQAAPPAGGTTLTVSSPAFTADAAIPLQNTQYGGNLFPGLQWSPGPRGTRSYVVIVQGESATGSGTSIHLTLINVPSRVTTLEAGMTRPPAGAVYGPNVHGPNAPYVGPHPHTTARQRYHFEVFALDRVIETQQNRDFAALTTALRGHVLASGELTGWAAKDPEATGSGD